MKDLLRRYLLIIVFGFSIGGLYADDERNHPGDSWINNSTSPQVENMILYGDVETSLFTGSLNFSIPIYSLEDPDFKLDLTLYYKSDGFKPCKHSGWVGYNWYLSAGGCITREVRGYADESVRKYKYCSLIDNASCYSEGMLHFILNNNYNPEDIFQQDASVLTTCYIPYTYVNGVIRNKMKITVGQDSNIDADYLPDLYHFNFLGYQGTFMINNQGKVQIVSGDYIDVDLSQTIDEKKADESDLKPMTPLTTSQITVKTKDGYTYVFGGKLSALEFTYGLTTHGKQYDQDWIDEVPPVISSWHLSYVKAPNGRTITYYYEGSKWDELDKKSSCLPVRKGEEGLWYNHLCYEHGANADIDFCDVLPSNVACYDAYGDPDPEAHDIIRAFIYNSHLRSCITKGCILDSVKISGEHPVCIHFYNSPRKRLFSSQGHILGYPQSQGNLMLDSVQIKSENRILSKAKMNYKTYTNWAYGMVGKQKHDSINNWHFLSNVNILGKGEYDLTYKGERYLPVVGFAPWYDCRIDSFSPDFYYERDVAVPYGYGRQCDIYQGLLSEVSFPTGGKQKFEYERHDWSKERTYRVDNGYLELYTMQLESIFTSEYMYSARIKHVATYDENDEVVEERDYIYKEESSGKPSGVLYNNEYIHDPSSVIVRSPNEYGLFSGLIGYSEVEERVRVGAKSLSRTRYKFDTGVDYFTSNTNSVRDGRVRIHISGDGKHVQKTKYYSGMLTYYENLISAGKIQSIDYYQGNHLVRTIERTYNGNPHSDPDLLGCVDTIVIFGNDYAYGYPYGISRKLYVYPDVLTEEITKDYTDDGKTAVVTTKTYSYDKKLRVIKETIKDSRDMDHFTKYAYPDNICNNTSDQSPLCMLIGRNRINAPIETISGYVFRNDDYITSGSINIYATENEGGHTYPFLSKTLSLAMTEPIEDYQPMRMNGNDVSYDSRYKLDAVYQFDKMNRPISIKPFGTIETQYTWNGIYPATKTIGDLTWKYSFIPYVGVHCITDPRGFSTYYDYDDAGRLIKEYTKDANGKEQILNVYQYHIKTEK